MSNALPCLPEVLLLGGAAGPAKGRRRRCREAAGEEGVSTRIDVLPNDGHTAWVALLVELMSTKPTIEESTMAGFEWLLT